MSNLTKRLGDMLVTDALASMIFYIGIFHILMMIISVHIFEPSHRGHWIFDLMGLPHLLGGWWLRSSRKRPT